LAKKFLLRNIFGNRQVGNSNAESHRVRTPTAKLIKYQDHDEWTELFDLAPDPYETKNLFNDPSVRGVAT